MYERDSYATRSTTVADLVVSNVLAMDRELNVVQPERDMFVTSARSTRASRQDKSDVQRRKVARVRALRQRQTI